MMDRMKSVNPSFDKTVALFLFIPGAPNIAWRLLEINGKAKNALKYDKWKRKRKSYDLDLME